MASPEKDAGKRTFNSMNSDDEAEVGRAPKRVCSKAPIRNPTTPITRHSTPAEEMNTDVSMHINATGESDIDVSMPDISRAADESIIDVSMRDASPAAQQSIMDVSMRDTRRATTSDESNMDISMASASSLVRVSGDVSMSVESSEAEVDQPSSGPSAAYSFDVPDDYEFSFMANSSLTGQHLASPGTISSFNPDSSVHGTPWRPTASATPIPAEQEAVPPLPEADSSLNQPNEPQLLLRDFVREEILAIIAPELRAVRNLLETLLAAVNAEQAAQEQERQDQAEERTRATQEREDQHGGRDLIEKMNEDNRKEHKKADIERKKAETARAATADYEKHSREQTNAIHGKVKTIADTRPGRNLQGAAWRIANTGATSDQSGQADGPSPRSFTSDQATGDFQLQVQLPPLAGQPARLPDNQQNDQQDDQSRGQPGGQPDEPEQPQDADSLFEAVIDFCRMQ